VDPKQTISRSFLETVLDFYRHPLRYRAWVDPAHPLPEGVEMLLDLAVARSDAESFRQQAEWLQVAPEELRTAVLFFIRQVLLVQRVDPYRTLGLTHAARPDQIRGHYRKLIRLFHPDREANCGECHAAYAARINQAYDVLRDPDKRRAYDSRSLRPHRAGASPKRRVFQETRKVGVPQKKGEIKILEMPQRWLSAVSRWRPSSLLKDASIPGRSPRARRFKQSLRFILSIAALSVSVLFVAMNLVAVYLSTNSTKGLDSNSSRSSESIVEREQPASVSTALAPRVQLAPVATVDLISSPAKVKSENEAQGLTEQELEHLLKRFASAHRAGDLEGFLALFAGQQVRIDDRHGREEIRKDYTAFFADTTLHYIRPRDFRWQINHRQAKGQGLFTLVVQQKKTCAIAIRYGSIMMSVERQPQGVVITELYHQYDKTFNHCEKRLYDHRLANSECTDQCRSFAGLAHSSLGNGTVLH
jgi:curved DNA-binding protein CbpA